MTLAALANTLAMAAGYQVDHGSWQGMMGVVDELIELEVAAGQRSRLCQSVYWNVRVWPSSVMHNLVFFPSISKFKWLIRASCSEL